MQQGLIDYNPQMETLEYDFEPPSSEAEAEVFSEAEQLELAAELLEVRDEAELEQFLGDLIKKGGSALGRVVTSNVGQSVGGLLKSAAKQALPAAEATLGSALPGRFGAQIGDGLASLAGSAFGLELEGLSPEDQEFEAARQFVRLAAETVKNATENGNLRSSSLAPHKGALAAFENAARKHAPGFASGGANSGHWKRQGRNILIVEL